jgi:hypothetical protein
MKHRRNIRIAVWAGLIVWSPTRDGGNSSSATTSAEIVTHEELRETAASQGSPIHWAGEQTGSRLELGQRTAPSSSLSPMGRNRAIPASNSSQSAPMPFPMRWTR